MFFGQDLNKKLGQENQIHAVKTDLSKEEQVLALYREIKDKYGKLDVVINNAGMATFDTLLEGKFENWKAMTDVGQQLYFISALSAILFVMRYSSTLWRWF